MLPEIAPPNSNRIPDGTLKELESVALLEITQRGLGKTNLYRLYLTVKKGVARRP